MTDFNKFTLSLHNHLTEIFDKNLSEEDKHKINLQFWEEIKELKCNDFRLYYYKAYFFKAENNIQEAQNNIDEAIKLVDEIVWYKTIKDPKELIIENGKKLFASDDSGNAFCIKQEHINQYIVKVFLLAGEIYAQNDDEEMSLKNYQIGQYYNSFLKPKFQDNVSVFSFRKFNEYSLSDLINNTITVSSSKSMNDPIDSIINLWANEENLEKLCKEQKHIKPYSKSFDYFRIRSFCINEDKTIGNVVMWSHYADEHRGFCIKYKLSKHFICQEKDSKNYEHMYLKKIRYSNKVIDLLQNKIEIGIAYATKKMDWKYENEVRLIVYNPNNTAEHYGIELDNNSEIEAIYFGYRCPDATITTIKNLFKANRYCPKFYKMELNENNIYHLKYNEI